MKKLFLIRHAKAAALRPGLPDFERPLTKKGIRSAKDMARRLREHGVTLDLLVSSPAHRALETAHIFAAEFDYPLQKIRLEDGLYAQTTRESLLELVRKLEDTCPTVCLFGHNPALQDFAQFLVKNLPGRLPKMGILGVEPPEDSWRSVAPGAEKLAFFDYPDREAEVARQKADDLAAEVSHAVEVVLERIEPSGLENVLPLVERSGRKIATEFLAALGKSQGKGPGGEGEKGEAAKRAAVPPKKEGATSRTKARRPVGTKTRTRKIRYVKPRLEKKRAKWMSAPALLPRPKSRPRRAPAAKKRRPPVRHGRSKK